METELVMSVCGLIFGVIGTIMGIVALILNLATRWSTHKMEFVPLSDEDVQDSKQMEKILNTIEEEEDYDSL